MVDDNNNGEGSTPTNNETTDPKLAKYNEQHLDKIFRDFRDELKGYRLGLDEIKSSLKPADKQDPDAKKLLEAHPLVQQMQDELKKAQAQIDKFASDKKRTRDKLAKSTLRDELLKGKMHPDAVEPLISHFAPNIDFESDDSDVVVYKVGDQVSSLAEAIEAFAKTPAGKFFTLARGLSGSGDGGYNKTATPTNELDEWTKFVNKP